VTFDPNRSLPDADRTNDVVEYAIPGCGDGILQAGEACDPATSPAPPCCDAAACTLRAAGTPCRPASGSCDAADVCDGAQVACPADAPAPAGTPCRPATDACDAAEACDGAQTTCPADLPAPAGTPCRAAADACDVAEACDGTNAACPADASAPDGTSCGDTGTACVAATCRAGSCASELEPGWCVVDDSCVPAGTAGPSVCVLCDPARDPYAWTPIATADRDGLGCRIDELAALAPAACKAEKLERVARRIDKLRSRLTQQAPARFLRSTKKFARAARRFRCLQDEASSLVSLARTYATSAELRAGG
jgi:hypothetical protein